MKTNLEIINYIETPRRNQQPMKLDRILKRRMKAFLRAREAAIAL